MRGEQASIAVILPAYNEELTIRQTMQAFHEALPEAAIIVVNNKSTDATYQIAVQTLSDLQCEGRVINENRQGKGNAMRRAFVDVDADIYVLADADMTYPAGQARELLLPVLENQADMVVGDRHSQGHYRKGKIDDLCTDSAIVWYRGWSTIYSAPIWSTL